MRDKALDAHFTAKWVAQQARNERFKPANEYVESIPTLTDSICPAIPATTRTGPYPLTLILPFPPSGNTSVRHVGKGHYRTREYNDFRAQVALITSQARAQTFTGPVEVTAMFWPPDKRQRDMDNNWKTLGDALQAAGVFKNDAQICRLELVKMPARKDGECSVTVKEAA